MALNLSLNKMPWYGQVGVFAVLGVLGAAAFWNWYAQSAQVAIEAQRSQLATLQAEIERGRAAERRLPEFRREMAVLEAQMAHLRSVLPEERDVADLLRRVQGMATQSSLTILGFTPRAIARKELYVEWPIGLKLEGTYHDLGGFLERISKFPRIINVSDLKVTAAERAPSGVTIRADATATTFVLIEQPAGAAGAAAPGVPPQRTE